MWYDPPHSLQESPGPSTRKWQQPGVAAQAPLIFSELPSIKVISNHPWFLWTLHFFSPVLYSYLSGILIILFHVSFLSTSLSKLVDFHLISI